MGEGSDLGGHLSLFLRSKACGAQSGTPQHNFRFMSTPIEFWGDVCPTPMQTQFEQKDLANVKVLLDISDKLPGAGEVWNYAMDEAAALNWTEGLILLKKGRRSHVCTVSRQLFWWCVKHDSVPMGCFLVSWMKEDPKTLDKTVLSEWDFGTGLNPEHVVRWKAVFLGV